MKEKIRLGYVGLGRRGHGMLDFTFSDMPDVEIVAICDMDESKLQRSVEMLEKKGRPAPALYTDYQKMLANEKLDAMAIMTGWNNRITYAIQAMEAGLYTAIEVGCAYDLRECYNLVETYERTGSPVMMLENCCYGRREMMALRMVKEGLFGEIVQCMGSYRHYLNHAELFNQNEDGTYKTDPNHYRLTEYIHRNCEQYPTHELGPIAKVLNINRGNRMINLRSFASMAKGLSTFMRDHEIHNNPYKDAKVNQGDIITTIIECAGGEQIILTLDTTLPRAFYSRDFTVRGTKGMCVESGRGNSTFYLDSMKEGVFGNEAEFYEKYDHPLHAEYENNCRGGHGGMDWLVVRAFVESVKNGTPVPIDAYDTATLLAVAPLSQASIAQNGAPVEFPDFTKGKWFHREPVTQQKYSLDVVYNDPDTPIIPKD